MTTDHEEECAWYDDPIFDDANELYECYFVRGDGWRLLQRLKEHEKFDILNKLHKLQNRKNIICLAKLNNVMSSQPIP